MPGDLSTGSTGSTGSWVLSSGMRAQRRRETFGQRDGTV